MSTRPGPSSGATRLAYILGVPLADEVVREWPQMGEAVHGRELIATVEGSFEALTLAVGERRRFGDTLVVEWSNDYGDGNVFRNLTIAELRNNEAVRVTDYWGPPYETPGWRTTLTARLEMPPGGRWPTRDELEHREP